MDDWIIRPSIRPHACQRLFCFPYAGVGASAFRNWADILGDEIEVCCIQLPGREQRLRERPAEAMRDVIPPLAGALKTSLDLPFAFYGHSLGARIAFETARELRRTRARQPFHLFVGASPAPQVPLTRPAIRHLDQRDFLDKIQSRYGGIPKPILEDAELLELLVPALRADVAMMETYRYEAEAPLGCPITAIGGNADAAVSEDSLAGWADQTDNRYTVHLLEGDHFFLNLHRRRLLQLISTSLAIPV